MLEQPGIVENKKWVFIAVYPMVLKDRVATDHPVVSPLLDLSQWKLLLFLETAVRYFYTIDHKFHLTTDFLFLYQCNLLTIRAEDIINLVLTITIPTLNSFTAFRLYRHYIYYYYMGVTVVTKLCCTWRCPYPGVGQENDGILVLGATNIPWTLDSAIRRR